MDVPLPFDAKPRWEKEARDKLKKIVRSTLKNDVKYVIDVRSGVPDLGIVRAASELGVDLIVMVTHGRHGIEHLLLGSVTEHVIREAPCPVLVLHSTPATTVIV